MSDDTFEMKPKKIYRGAFDYFREGTIYAQETFEVFKNKKNFTTHYSSELLSRVSTGELLKITVDYKVDKDFVPTTVKIHKLLGKDFCHETFKYSNKTSTLTYIIESNEGKKKMTISSSPKFHITTPTATTSILYFLVKKFDGNSKNMYNSINTINEWSFKEAPKNGIIQMEKISVTSEEIKVGTASVQAVQYKVCNGDHANKEDKFNKKAPAARVFLSSHGAIPYIIEDSHGGKIAIRYLNNLQEES